MRKRELEYRDQRWFVLKEHVLKRDKNICRFCNCTENQMEVHHMGYVFGKPIYDVHPDMLITLCNKCHHQWHSNNEDLEYPGEYEALLCIRDALKISPGEDIREEYPYKKEFSTKISYSVRLKSRLENLSSQINVAEEDVVLVALDFFLNLPFRKSFSKCHDKASLRNVLNLIHSSMYANDVGIVRYIERVLEFQQVYVKRDEEKEEQMLELFEKATNSYKKEEELCLQ